MAVSIINQQFFEVIAPSPSGTIFSLFNIGESLNVWTDIEFFTQVNFTAATPLKTGDAANQNHLYGSGKFANVSVGDTIRIVDGSGFFSTAGNQKVTVLIKYSNNEVKVSDAIVSGNPMPNSGTYPTAVMYNLTEIKSLDFYYNFIENSQPNNFISLTTGQTHLYKATNIDTATFGSPALLIPQGGNEWQCNTSFVADSDIYRVSYDSNNGKQIFRIRHYVVATPLYLATQLTDAQNDIAPPYYLNANCLKYIVKVVGLRSLYDPNSVQFVETDPSVLGNSGWFNETFNQGAQNYFMQNIQYYNSALLETAINPFSSPYNQRIEFDLYSPDGDFQVNQRIAIGAMKMPNSASEYQNNGRTLNTNFLFSNNYGLVNSSTYTNPYGTDGNFVEKWKATRISANIIHVVMYLAFTSDTMSIIQESQIPRFAFFATLANPSLTTAATQNKQTIWSGVKEFDGVVIPADINCTQTFKRHYEDADDDGITGLITTFKNDECVMESVISAVWSETPSTSDEVYLTKVYQQVVAKRISDGVEFLLEDFQLPIPVIFQSGAPYINYSSNRVFNIPITEIRKRITITVIDASPTPGNAKFKISYPFMIRWETWVQLIGANTDFFNTSEPNNGLNQDWEHYINSNWEIYFRTGYDVTSSINAYHFDKDIIIPINDYATNPDYSVKKVETFTTGGTALLSTGINYIQAAQNTVVRATFTKPTGLLIANCRVVFGIEVHNQGGISGRVRFSSVWETSYPLTWFIPISGTDDKVILSQLAADTIKAEAVLDCNALPVGNIQYDIVARLYEVPAPIDPEDYKTMTDGTYKTMTDGTYKTLA